VGFHCTAKRKRYTYTNDKCFKGAAEETARRLAGTSVLLSVRSAVDGSAVHAYVTTRNPDGNSYDFADEQ